MKKENKGIVIMILNIAIMVSNYVINLINSQSETVASICKEAVDFIC